MVSSGAPLLASRAPPCQRACQSRSRKLRFLGPGGKFCRPGLLVICSWSRGVTVSTLDSESSNRGAVGFALSYCGHEPEQAQKKQKENWQNSASEERFSERKSHKPRQLLQAMLLEAPLFKNKQANSCLSLSLS